MRNSPSWGELYIPKRLFVRRCYPSFGSVLRTAPLGGARHRKREFPRDPHRVSFAGQVYALKTSPESFPHVNKLVVEETDRRDHNDLVHNWKGIADAYGDIVEACAANKAKEFTLRRGVDTLLVRSARSVEGITVR